MDGGFDVTPVVAWFFATLVGTPAGLVLATLAALGVRDRRARTDPAALLLSSLALVINGTVCVVVGPGFWWFWPALVAAVGGLVAVHLCLQARFAGPSEPDRLATRLTVDRASAPRPRGPAGGRAFGTGGRQCLP
jgi:hypothetical protein